MASNTVNRFSGENNGVQHAININTGKQTFEIYNRDKRDIFQSITYVADALFNPWNIDLCYCYPNTRLQILGDIHQWIKGDDGHIFWLNGFAGTGKSTIARTIARDCFKSDESLWVTSFFFSSNNADVNDARKNFVPTLAFQLLGSPIFKNALEKASLRYPGIQSRELSSQWDGLIRAPLSQLDTEASITLLIVIDALDECEKGREAVLDLIKDNPGIGPVRFRFLVTNRYKAPVSMTPKPQQCALQSLSADEDIRMFLKGSLEQEEFSPDSSQMDALVKTAGGLFLCAETACGYITGGGESDLPTMKTRLKEILESHRDRETVKRLDMIYSTVLKSFPRESETLRKVLIKSIVVLYSPLCLKSFCELLETDVEDTRDIIKNKYPAIIHLPEDESSPLRIHHVCLSEFLFDEKRSRTSGFHVNRSQAHRELMDNSIRVMRENLKETVCACLSFSGPITEMARSLIASEIQYSCRHWTQHLIQSVNMRIESGQILSFLKENFMHWLAAMSIMRRISEAVEAIKGLLAFFSTAMNPELSEFLHDAKRFILKTRQLADTAPLELYSSGLLFCPESSLIKQTFKTNMSNFELRKVEKTWDAELQALEGHCHAINSIAFSPIPDIHWLASSSHNNVNIWDHKTGELLLSHKGPWGQVNSVAFSSDARLLAYGSHDQTYVLRVSDEPEIVHTFRDNNQEVLSVAFAPDSEVQLLASGSRDGTVRIWDCKNDRLYRTLPADCGQINSIAFLPDPNSRLLASAYDHKTIIIWNYDTGKRFRTLKHFSAVTSIACLPDPGSRILAFGSHDRTIRIWDCDSGDQKRLRGHKKQVNCVAFSPDPDSKLLASGSHDRTIRIWDYNTEYPRYTIHGHSKSVNSVAFLPESNAQLLASSSDDQLIKLWNLNMIDGDRSLQRCHSEGSSALLFSGNGQILASFSGGQDMKLWNPSTGDPIDITPHPNGQIKCIAFSPDPDSQLLASGSYDGTIRIWNLSTTNPPHTLEGHIHSVASISFSRDGQLLASGSDNGDVKLWDFKKDALPKPLGGHNSVVRTVKFSPSSKLLASGSHDRTVKIWDCYTGKLVHHLKGHSKNVTSIDFSPHGKLLASGSGDETVKIWDLETGLLKILSGHGAPVKSLAFSPDGKLLASVFFDKTTRVWNLTSKMSCEVLEGHSGLVWSERNFHVSIKDSQWICYQGEKKLWLPAEYRKTYLALKGNILAFSNSSGRVSFISI